MLESGKWNEVAAGSLRVAAPTLLKEMSMIHFTCDCCKRSIDLDREVRYVVRLEVYAAIDPSQQELEGDRDYLEEIEDILAHNDDASDANIGADVYQQVRYDVCCDCRRKLVANPLARMMTPQFDFSNN